MPQQSDSMRRAAPAKCTACSRPMNSPLFCDACRSLYPADGMSHFELLGFEPTFDIDAPALRRKYLQLSRGVHPDHHDGGDSGMSLRLSAQLNEAHRVLADPVLRAEYLLELSGGQSASEDSSVPRDVLTSAFMLREEIAEAQSEHDEAGLAACATKVRERYSTALAEVSGLAAELPGDVDLRSRMRAALNAIKYYEKLRAEL